mmetsp:Transcript_41969/g.135780  ORF Transcript_41969/g.135780 Transcript_41969/m.135780 type:complete len:230 (-) Transcript_41969:191-880(-)
MDFGAALRQEVDAWRQSQLQEVSTCGDSGDSPWLQEVSGCRMAAHLRKQFVKDMQEWAAKSAHITHLLVEHIKKRWLVDSRQGLTQKVFSIPLLVMALDPDTKVINPISKVQNPIFDFGSAPGWIKGAFLSKGAYLKGLHAGASFALKLRDVVDQVLPRVEAALKQQGLEVSTRKANLTVSWAAPARGAPQVPPMPYAAPPVNAAGHETAVFLRRSGALGAPALTLHSL